MIIEREQQLLGAMKAQGYQPFFDGDEADALETIESAMKSLVDYQNSVIHQQIMQPIFNVKYMGEPDKMQEAIMGLDQKRRIQHESAIANCNMLNRISQAYGVPDFAPIDTKDRYQVADFIGQFCGEVYEARNGGANIQTEDQLYAHRGDRRDLYDNQHILEHTMEAAAIQAERSHDVDARFGHITHPADNTIDFTR